ncbi:NAD(P)/FAD-dependent oxidoreductase [Modicisalibacter coralii]|uniref:NAD(P)/FAD-dependent oxidoreductase n=1 Tax=Modicisalibacter coralii TaxID=2304602 RepID=UPI00100BFE04|nr:FAD-binding oxidoreductase [Halomonas coralii]
MDDTPPPNYWRASLDREFATRPSLRGRQKADVAIIGAGFTGLWTAYYLKTLDPQREVTVIEAERIGHGASGRNGGWVIGSLAGLERHVGDLDRARRQDCCRVLADNVDALGATLAREGIAADFHKGGAIYAAARYRDQLAIQRDYLAHLHELGHSETDCHWLSADELTRLARFRKPFGGIYQRQVATVHPLKLLHGLAETLERLGVILHEQSRAQHVDGGCVQTREGSVTAPMIVCATEGYAERLADFRRHVIPVHSLVIATEPLSEAQWQAVGLDDRPTFADASRLVNYGQRSADGRLIFGARGSYSYGARPRHGQAIDPAAIDMRRDLLVDLFPALEGIRVDHGWGGSLGLSRNFRPHAIVDRDAGLATAGGYAGEGVAASHLFGRTLAEQILGHDSELTGMPWAFSRGGHRQLLKRWEPEPLRWLAAQAITLSYAGEEALMKRERPAPLIKPALTRLNDVFASVIE